MIQVHGKKAVVNFRLHPDDVVREPRKRGASCSSADTSGPSYCGKTMSFIPGVAACKPL